ncbi:MAG: hypothetical protein GX544_06000, partial [Chloroflexi bacterium]|nr:hypothetical protein [Chloroflexota bacterium]
MNRPAIFTNAHFPTRQSKQAGSVLVEDGKIRFLGDPDQVSDLAPRHVEEIDLAGKTVLPGLCDFHLHLVNTAEKLDAV